MKLNWTTFKMLFAFVIIIGTIFWTLDSLRPRVYSGTALNFPVGSGPVTLTNTSDESVAVRLVSPGTRFFSVVSTVEGISGTSTRQSNGSPVTQLFEFVLAPGVSEFTLTRGANVTFVANTNVNLAATVQPTDTNQSRIIIVVAVVVMLGMLFYMSHTTEHRWIMAIWRDTAPVQETSSVTVAGGQGRTARTYGDNRVDSSP